MRYTKYKKNRRIKKRKTIRKRKHKGGDNLKVLYLINTDKGLPELYNSIRDKSIVLSFKEETPDTKIFLPNSTWTDARNKLREYAMNLPEKYDYYVLMDNDMKFRDFSQEEGFKKFEERLSLIKPDIGCTKYLEYGIGVYCMKDLGQEKKDPNCDKELEPKINAEVLFFDPCMNAFSKDVFFSNSNIFPYDNAFDNRSWWASSYNQIIRAHYHNIKAILFNDIVIINTGHNSYTKDGSTELKKEIYEHTMKTIPEDLKEKNKIDAIF